MKKHCCLLVVFGFLLITSVSVSATGPLLPLTLMKIAEEHNCEPYKNFYNYWGMMDPMFLWGFHVKSFEGKEYYERENSAVFWCVKKGTDTFPPTSLLIFKVFDRAGNPEKILSCPKVIEMKTFPRGLSIYRNSEVKLEDFHYLKDEKKPGPKSVVPDGNFIVSVYDGIPTMFYCYKGGWLIRFMD